MKEIWTVSELNEDIKSLLEEHYGFLWVEGEISNLRRPASGHVYFTLKDDKSQIRAVMFRSPYGGGRLLGGNAMSANTMSGKSAGFELEDGLHISCRARITVYSPRGEYQLIIDRVEPRGLGALQKAFEQLKARLQAEGLFDPDRKQKIPYLPERIGVVTSPSGAVIRDILHVTARRFGSVPIVVAPVRVQGPEAPDEIVRAIRDLNKLGGIDVIIVARGGGSLEDLQPFNTELVARAVFASEIPVISAVGHETDFTIADFVADLRAPTPSAAAELAVPSREDLQDQASALYRRLLTLARRDIDHRRQVVTGLGNRLRDPRRVLEDQRLKLDYQADRMLSVLSRTLAGQRHAVERLAGRLDHAGPAQAVAKHRMAIDFYRKNMTSRIKNVMESSRQRLVTGQTALNALNPLGVLDRGYSLTTRVPDGAIVRDAGALAPGEDVRVRLAKGGFTARVSMVESGAAQPELNLEPDRGTGPQPTGGADGKGQI